jgi:hypothetical protein
MAPSQPRDGNIVADEDEKVLRGVFIPHAVDAPLVTVSVAPPSDEDSGTGAIPPRVVDAFVSLVSESEVFPGDEAAVARSDSPFARRVELPIAILYMQGSKEPRNMRASRLTMELESGEAAKISGGALVLGCAGDPTNWSSYSSVVAADLGAMDNALHDEVMEYFCQGLVPRKEDLDRILAGFRAGGFRYDVAGEAAGEPAEDGQEDTRGKSDKKSEGERTQRKGRDGKNGIDGERDGKEQALPGWGAADGDWH